MRPVILLIIIWIALTSCTGEKKFQDGTGTFHTIEINHPVHVPEEGLLLGNGDLSVSIYQTANAIIWRFGKNDVWDRRHDTRDNPEPAHIDEIARGIREEGWVNNSFTRGEVKSIYGKPLSERALELCNGTPSYAFRPYPCPKPVGELAFNLPMDQKLVSISQVLTIEQAIATIEIVFESGVKIHLDCFIPPDNNQLILNWQLDNWNDTTATGSRPCNFSLYRWADQTIEDFAKEWRANTGSSMFMRWADPDLDPLPPPETGEVNSVPVITQRFHPDNDSDEGFRCVMIPFAPGSEIKILNSDWDREARLQIMPGSDDFAGNLAVAIVTGDEPGEVNKRCQEIISSMGNDLTHTIQKLRQETIDSGNEFWKRSEVVTDDPLFDAVWYETLHAKRSTFRGDVIAPGLYLPSTLNDYSPWHGDYHTDYNYQSEFWGSYDANQVDLGDSFFPGMKYMVELGRDLARKYWDSQGVYIQVSGYPFTILKDPYGVGSCSRMAYMTGWIANHYWYRYLYTMDTTWLEQEGYPVIRDASIFFADFLEKGDDGRYHAFPSCEGESHYTGNPEDFTDKPQVLRHARYSLQVATDAAEVLNKDELARQQWQEIAENIVDVDSLEQKGYTMQENNRYYANSPEFFSMPDVLECHQGNRPGFLRQTQENAIWSWYFGQFPWVFMSSIRNGNFEADRDYNVLQEFFNRWRLPNGLFRGMSQTMYGYQGAMTECLGIQGPMSEMLIQSWEGYIRVFPAWPKNMDASFRDLRARGAFLVSSRLMDGEVEFIQIRSEHGGDCIIINPWNSKTLRISHNGVDSKVDVDSQITLTTLKNDIIIIKP